MLDHHKQKKCPVKILDCSNLVWQCMFISWSVLWKCCFAVFKVKFTVKVHNFSKCSSRQYNYLWSIKLSMVMHHHESESELSYRNITLLFSRSKPQSFLQDLQKYLCNPDQSGATPSQDLVRHCENFVLLLPRVWDRGCCLGDCGPKRCHFGPS